MEITLHIKNMVCNRCKTIVKEELESMGYHIHSLELGQVVLNEEAPIVNSILEEALIKHGFELIKDESKVLIEKVKISLINKIEYQDNSKLPFFLSKTFHKSYSALSKLFSKKEGITIEKYEINLKVEKVKELIQLGQLNFSEIAYSLDYSNSGYLARQFKNNTGISMTEFKNLQNWDRKSIDQIV